MKIVVIGNGLAAVKALEAMAHYREFVYVKVDKAAGRARSTKVPI